MEWFHSTVADKQVQKLQGEEGGGGGSTEKSPENKQRAAHINESSVIM